jgi:hypothetical protein
MPPNDLENEPGTTVPATEPAAVEKVAGSDGVKIEEVEMGSVANDKDGPKEIEPVKIAPEEKTEEKPKEQVKDIDKPSFLGVKLWIYKCFFASICMAFGNYIYATKFSKDGIIAVGYLGPLPLALLFIYYSVYMIITKTKTGNFIDNNNSNFFRPDGSFQKINLVPLLGNWYANSAHIFIYSFAFRFAKKGGINQSIVPAMVIFATIFNTISFYLKFGQTVSCTKLIGMLFTISSLGFFVVDASQKNGEIKDAGEEV